MKKLSGIVLGMWLVAPVNAAQFPDSERELATGSAGQLMQLQREGRLASSNPQPATDLEREKAVDRFLKTYNNAIPAAGGSGGTGTSGGGAATSTR